MFPNSPFWDRFPTINNLIQRINLRKRRDSLILGSVIGICTILLLLYALHWRQQPDTLKDWCALLQHDDPDETWGGGVGVGDGGIQSSGALGLWIPGSWWSSFFGNGFSQQWTPELQQPIIRRGGSWVQPIRNLNKNVNCHISDSLGDQLRKDYRKLRLISFVSRLGRCWMILFN